MSKYGRYSKLNKKQLIESSKTMSETIADLQRLIGEVGDLPIITDYDGMMHAIRLDKGHVVIVYDDFEVYYID